MRWTCCCVVLLVPGCFAESMEVERPECVACQVAESPPPFAHEAEPEVSPRLPAPERCEAVARAYLPTAPDRAWYELWLCVTAGRFTALRPLLDDAWDHELRTRRDAPLLLTRVIAARGGNIEEDLRLLHDRRLPLFGLAQAMTRPELFRGALVILRARLSDHGVVDETRLVSQPWEVPLAPAERIMTQAPPPFAAKTRRDFVTSRYHNLDVTTGTRALAAIDADPFIDAEEALVVLGRFEGTRDSDGWPMLTVLEHVIPSTTLTF
jgi:hypothetical protein